VSGEQGGGRAGQLSTRDAPAALGPALVRRWRCDGLAAPVLLLPSASAADLRQGADACLPLPCCFAELLARLWAWIKPLGALKPSRHRRAGTGIARRGFR
jgi:hypothetical protein